MEEIRLQSVYFDRLTFARNPVYLTQRQNTPPWRHSGMKRPVVEDSLEKHIQLCAEGARRKPNLSGKRTEMQAYGMLSAAVLSGTAFVFFRNLREY